VPNFKVLAKAASFKEEALFEFVSKPITLPGIVVVLAIA
jgi:hypothetical protein